jgi:hypothetical protein
MMSRTHHALNARLTKILVAQAIPAKLTIDARPSSRPIRVVMRMLRRGVDRLASRALASPRQHFLKRDAVFFNVLVYSR